LELTEQGNALAVATVQEKKEIFRLALLAKVNPARDIVEQLNQRDGHRMSAEGILDELERHFSFEEARRQLDVLIGWGRYGETYAFDEVTDDLFLEHVDQAAPAGSAPAGA
jgi:NitT/TauT family transport system ATP-binding protein